MSREIDRRDLSINKVTPAREKELNLLASEVSLPGAHRVRIERFDPTTGNPAVVISESAPAEKENYIQRALDHVKGISKPLGLTAVQSNEFVPDPNIQKTKSEAVAVHLQQQYKGIPIFQAAQTVRFAPDGALKETVGNSVTVSENKEVQPKISVKEAVKSAARHVAAPRADEAATDQFGQPRSLTTVDVTGFEPKTIAAFTNKPEQPTVFEPGPFGDRITANLVWFPLSPENLRLGWEVIIAMPKYEGQYRTIVDAENGQILYCHQLVKYIAARGNIYQMNGGSPRKMTDFPRPLADYEMPIPNNLPSGFPDTWVEADMTVGNSVRAHLGDNGAPIQGAIQNGLLTFDPEDPEGDDQKVLNIFYFNCYMHNFLYLCGFQEKEGNFQQDNFSRGGLASDRVDARAHSGVVDGTANMYTPVDGESPVMNMGLVISANDIKRHTAFDSSVVFHEYTHGLTNRLVGGPMNNHALDAPQSGGIGEGSSDYIACTINNTTVVGDWVVNDPKGIRQYPYDSNFPDHFGMLGKGRYTEEHNIGEIWCATLMEMNRNIGADLGVQLFVDALKLSPANPSFLDLRDSILTALEYMKSKFSPAEYSTYKNGIWKAFAKFGMGPEAQSNGASLTGIIPHFDINPRPRVNVVSTQNLAIPDKDPVGVTDVLTVSQAGKIGLITVKIDIEHTYIGDLQVSLITPGGSTVLLHSMKGGKGNNLIRSYTTADTPALFSIIGEQAQGNWTLKVADRAKRNTGTLRNWGLEIGLDAAANQTASEENAQALDIPDNDPAGVTSSINISQSGTAKQIKVNVDITHSYIGDLRVELVSPAGQHVILHDNIGGNQHDLITTYDSASTPSLSALLDQPINGKWDLQVTDLALQDIGVLNKWNLELVYS